MAFEPITTQEELDAVIGERLGRERENWKKKVADYDDLKAKNEALTKELQDLTSGIEETKKKESAREEEMQALTKKLHDFEGRALKTSIAHEYGIPYELSGRLSGEDEKAIREDAEAFAKILSARQKPVDYEPLRSTESEESGEQDVYKKLLKGLKGE